MIRYLSKIICFFGFLTLLLQIEYSSLQAQEYEVPKNEFRATWIATVINLDWPQSSGLPPRYKKEDLLNKFDRLKEAELTCFFQIRTEMIPSMILPNNGQSI